LSLDKCENKSRQKKKKCLANRKPNWTTSKFQAGSWR